MLASRRIEAEWDRKNQSFSPKKGLTGIIPVGWVEVAKLLVGLRKPP